MIQWDKFLILCSPDGKDRWQLHECDIPKVVVKIENFQPDEEIETITVNLMSVSDTEQLSEECCQWFYVMK